MGDLQPLASPNTLDPLVVDYPARLAQQPCNLAIAVAAVLPGKLDNIGRQTLLVLTAARDLALRRAMLPERRTGATLGNVQLRSHLLNAVLISPRARPHPTRGQRGLRRGEAASQNIAALALPLGAQAGTARLARGHGQRRRQPLQRARCDPKAGRRSAHASPARR